MHIMIVKRKPIGVEFVGIFHQYLNFCRIKYISYFCSGTFIKGNGDSGKIKQKEFKLEQTLFSSCLI